MTAVVYIKIRIQDMDRNVSYNEEQISHRSEHGCVVAHVAGSCGMLTTIDEKELDTPMSEPGARNICSPFALAPFLVWQQVVHSRLACRMSTV